MGHPVDKVELIIMGGTFTTLPGEYQYRFIKECYEALNGSQSDTLEESQRANETAEHRCVGLCIETRPDYCEDSDIKRLLDFGATRIELGVQTLDDEILEIVKRRHTAGDVAQATARLKDHGFKVHYHWMPGLPGSSPEKDLDMFSRLFSDSCFRPDGLKIYPTLVIKGTELEGWYRNGQYRPYDDDAMIELIAEMKSLIPRYVRLSRVMREIPTSFITAGLRISPREVIRRRLTEMGRACSCIRCREYGHRALEGYPIGEPRLRRLDYSSSNGREVMLSFEDNHDTLFGLLRLRIPGKGNSLFDGHQKVALVRELHVYGPEVPLGMTRQATAQHRGLGRRLLAEAERVASEDFGAGLIAVLSEVGAREYYRSKGYRLDSGYMVKTFNPLCPSSASAL